MSEAHWYVVHTYSGYENKVKVDIEKTIENRNLQDQILEVSVPMLPVVELKNGVEKKADKKMFPGYVLINMVMNDDTWYVVRNTRGVTGFVGPGSKPVPLTEEEMASLGFHREEDVLVNFEAGDMVVVISGAWKDTVGAIKAINDSKKTITMHVEMFGRETPVELGFAEVKKMFPGYVLINMVMNDDTWYVVRNTRGVTGFVGPGSKPVPLTEEEMASLGFRREEDVLVDFEVGDMVVVISGAWKDTVGAIKAINDSKKTITMHVEMFGRETPVELGFAEVKRM